MDFMELQEMLASALRKDQPQEQFDYPPLNAQNRASIDAGLQALRASGLPKTDDGAAQLVQRLNGASAGLGSGHMLSTALRQGQSQSQGADYPDMQAPQMMQPAPQGLSASMGPVAMVDRTPMEQAGDVSASMGPVAMLGRTPEQGTDGTEPLSAGLQAMRVALPPGIDPELLRKLQSARAGR